MLSWLGRGRYSELVPVYSGEVEMIMGLVCSLVSCLPLYEFGMGLICGRHLMLAKTISS